MSTSCVTGRQLQRGLSLVELMVAMGIGVFLLAGAVAVFGKTRDLYRTNDATARLQETARYAMSTIEADLRMANSWGLMTTPNAIDNSPRLDTANPPAIAPGYALPAELAPYAGAISQCGAMWAVKLFAYVEANNDAYGYACAEFGTAVPGSDQLTIRRVSTQEIQPAALAASAGQIKVQASRLRGSLFASGVAPADYLDPTSDTHALIANGYYVDQDSNERDGTPSLRRKQLEVAGGATVMGDQQIVPGVEDLQVEFGADLDDDQNADYFVQPNTVDSRRRRDCRGSCVAPGAGGTAGERVHRRPQLHLCDRVAYTPADAFRRILVSKTIALRNTRR